MEFYAIKYLFAEIRLVNSNWKFRPSAWLCRSSMRRLWLVDFETSTYKKIYRKYAMKICTHTQTMLILGNHKAHIHHWHIMHLHVRPHFLTSIGLKIPSLMLIKYSLEWYVWVCVRNVETLCLCILLLLLKIQYIASSVVLYVNAILFICCFWTWEF